VLWVVADDHLLLWGVVLEDGALPLPGLASVSLWREGEQGVWRSNSGSIRYSRS
jgi:hypothetical protein